MWLEAGIALLQAQWKFTLNNYNGEGKVAERLPVISEDFLKGAVRTSAPPSVWPIAGQPASWPWNGHSGQVGHSGHGAA